MNQSPSKQHNVTVQDLDALLQDTYLVVVELRQGATIQDSKELWSRCEQQVDQVQQHLREAGVERASVELISHAQCALLDETALACAKGEAHAKWASQPLQTRFFSSHQAGEFLYEDMREALRQPAPDELVLTAFQRVLMLGFQGRYRDASHPEREQLMAALNAQVVPLTVDQALVTQTLRHHTGLLRSLGSPLLHIVAAGLMLVGVWWGLNHWLGALIATLVLERV